jgi:hypothetical protein
MHRRAYTLTEFPDDLKKKVTLLKHFKGYMQENLSKVLWIYEACAADAEQCRAHSLEFLTKYVRTAKGVVFRLSNYTMQVHSSN